VRPAYLRRLLYRNREGAWAAVYATEPLGHTVARQVLGRAPAAAMQDVKPHFIEHTVRLNDLYVALAEGCARQRLPPARYPFCWISTDNVGLPWRELSGRTGRMEERRLVPDGILEFPRERIRVFLECEMGGNPLVRKDENAVGAALSKLNRYGSVRAGRHAADLLRAEVPGWVACGARLLGPLGNARGEPLRPHRALAGAESGGSDGSFRLQLYAGSRLFLRTPPRSDSGGELRVSGAARPAPHLSVRVAGRGDLQGSSPVPPREPGDPGAGMPLSRVHARVRAHGRARRALQNAAGSKQ